MKIENLTIEDMAAGCITDQKHPVFSFYIYSEKQNVCLKDAEVTVRKSRQTGQDNTDPAQNENREVLWQIHTAEQIGIRYEGSALAALQKYTITVKATDNYGETAVLSANFETGLLENQWHGIWITDKEYHFKEKKISPVPMTFRRVVPCRGKIERARIFSTAVGIYELSFDGTKVGKDYFAPGLTSYSHTLQYQIYDITEQIRKSDKKEYLIQAVVAGGWASGAFTFSRANRITAPRQAFLAQIQLLYEDGTEEWIGTDASWQVSLQGSYRQADFYDGEFYDATVSQKRISWHQASPERLRITPKLLASYGSPVQVQECRKPVSCTVSDSGELIYDFGQNFAGVVHAVINGKKEQKIVFRHTELLMDGELFTKPLRTAKASAVYICKEGSQEYSPRLTYMGFRYVGVTGIEQKDLELTAYVLYSNMQENGSFACSHPLINRLQENICWSTRSNFVDIPTDCPQRDERMGWTGDIALFAPTACFNFDIRRFLKKWLTDVKAEQRPLGGINVVIPAQGFHYPFAVVAYWGDCCILVPWAMYQAYGDKEILKKMYPVMKKYLKAVKFWAGFACIGRTHRHTWRWWHQYGDWVAPGIKMWSCMNRGLWTATACWSNSCRLMMQIADILGYPEDRKYYDNLRNEINRSYSIRFLDETGKMKKLADPFARNAQGKEVEFQSGYVLPLAFDMLSGTKKEGALDRLVSLVRKADYHIGTGFPGTPYILYALMDNGREEEAYRMLLQEGCPSWLYEAKTGTTIWERWDALREDGTCNTGEDDGTNGMTSFNHYASGAVGNFLYQRIAGIEALEAGYRKFRIKPIPGGGLNWAKGSVVSPYGEIRSEWKIQEKQFQIHVEIPACATCELILPDQTKHELGSGSYDFAVSVTGIQKQEGMAKKIKAGMETGNE